MDGDLIVGRQVKYTKTKDIHRTGLVIDRITMLAKPGEPGSPAITGYVIEDDESSMLEHVAHWRVIQVLGFIEEENFNKQ